MSVRKMVNSFAEITGQEGTKQLYLTLIEEEYDEWKKEIGGHEPVRELKELSDLVYVIYGYARAVDFMLVPSVEQLTGDMAIQDTIDLWLEEYGCGSARREHMLLEKVLGLIYNYAAYKGWDLDEAVRRVHNNNVGRCVQPDGTVQRRTDGKIIKNETYPKVELGDLT